MLGFSPFQQEIKNSKNPKVSKLWKRIQEHPEDSTEAKDQENIIDVVSGRMPKVLVGPAFYLNDPTVVPPSCDVTILRVPNGKLFL